jgi:hypothetical protein
MTDQLDAFTRLRLESRRTFYVLHGWRAADGSVGRDYFKQAHSLSEAIADLEANDCSAEDVTHEIVDVFVSDGDDRDDLQVHVELSPADVGTDEVRELFDDDRPLD